MSNFLKAAFERLFGVGKNEQKISDKKSASQLEVTAVEVEVPVTLTIWTIERNRYAAVSGSVTHQDRRQCHAQRGPECGLYGDFEQRGARCGHQRSRDRHFASGTHLYF